MYRKIYLIIFAMLPVFILLSCKKDGRNHNENKTVTLNVSVNAGETFRLDLGQYADVEDQANITRQATTYSLSAINQTSSGKYYQFSRAGTPKTGGNGTDQVVLKIVGRESRCRQHDETNITINLTIL